MRVGRPSRWWQWAALAVAVLVVAWLVFAFLVIANPTVDHPRRADAVVVLGPAYSNGRVDVGISLMDEHVAKNLVISMNAPGELQSWVCTAPHTGYSVTCFKPDPATTRGEAEHVRDLARQHGWRSIVVVTSTYHASRARMIFKRCLDGPLYLVAARHGISLSMWAKQFIYQTGAYVKAGLRRGC